MTPGQFSGLLIVWVMSVFFILTLTYREFRRVRFNFNVFFSLVYSITFYLGFPLTCLLVLQFDVAVISAEFLLYALLVATAFYAIYYVSYKIRLAQSSAQCRPVFGMNRLETHFTWILLALVALSTVAVFFLQNGFLLFKLSGYSQVFAKSEVSVVALKRFFYFFIPAMLILYFLKQDKRAWWLFLVSTVVFGGLNYVIIGGTRANMMVPVALFLFIGMIRGWITLWMLITAGSGAIVMMFWLALKRYGLDIDGLSTWYDFLRLTRDTFSPWENLALLFENYYEITFQGLTPVVRDFYVFIPKWLWPARPDEIVNTSNYFTWEILKNYSGLTISQTLIGSVVIMGGVWLLPAGAVVTGLVIRWFDWLYQQGKLAENRYSAAIIQSFCFGAMFNLIVLVREGLDSFVSRMVFFSFVFAACLVMAKLLYWFFDAQGMIKAAESPSNQPLSTIAHRDQHRRHE